MVKDCFRCGHGWNHDGGCPICPEVSDNGARFIKSMREEMTDLRRIARKAFNSPQYSGLKTEEGLKVGIYGA